MAFLHEDDNSVEIAKGPEIWKTDVVSHSLWWSPIQTMQVHCIESIRD